MDERDSRFIVPPVTLAGDYIPEIKSVVTPPNIDKYR
jgi:hypothetical protein